MSEVLQAFGHHPEADFDFAIEVEALEGMAYEVGVGMSSQWPFWGRLSQALRLGRSGEWFGRPDLEPVLRGLEHTLSGRDRDGNGTERPQVVQQPRDESLNREPGHGG